MTDHGSAPADRPAAGRRDTVRWFATTAAVLSVGASLARLWSSTPTSRIDFYVYGEAIAFARGGGSLYDFAYEVLGLPFLYPPFAALVLWPASVLTDRTGEVLGLLVTMGCTVAFLGVVGSSLAPVVARRWSEAPLARPVVLVPAVIAAGVWAMPVTLTARLGQVNALIAALVVLDVWLVRRAASGAPSRIAGIGTGLAAAIKLTPAALVPYFLLVRRGRQAAVAVAAALLATAAGALVFPADTWRYFTVEVFSTDRAPDVSIVFNHSVRRFASWIPDERAELLVWVVVSVAVMVWAYRRAVAADRSGDVMLATTLVLLATYLVNPLTWGHHLFFLVPATLWWLATSDSWWRWVVGAVAVVSLFDPIGGGETSEMTVVRVGVMAILLVALPVGDAVPAERSLPSQSDQRSAP